MTTLIKDDHHSFVNHYTSNGNNGTQAALSAGYAKASAANTASRLLKRPDIQAEIARLRENVGDATQMDAQKWLRAVIADIALARQWKNASAVMRGHELVGRAIRVFADSELSDRERAAFAWLGKSVVDNLAQGSGGVDALMAGRDDSEVVDAVRSDDDGTREHSE